jgi:hypothetical protein
MALKFAITNLAGQQIAVVTDYDQGLVTIPYNDSRTAEVTLHPESPAGLKLGEEDNGAGVALRLMLKAWYIAPPYNPLLVFWGPIITPTWTLRAGQKTLRLEAHDMSIRLKNHYLSGADSGTIFTGSDGQVIVSWEGLRVLRDAGKNSAAENTALIPDLGIGDGTNTHPGGYAVTYLTTAFASGNTTMHVESTVGFPDSGNVPDDTIKIGATEFTYTGRTATTFTGLTYAGATLPIGTQVIYDAPRFLKVQKGDEVWQRWTEIANDPFGPDFRLRPDDSTPGIYALLDTFDKRETSEGGTRDKRYSVIFQAGFGTDNVTDFDYAPQGGSTWNVAVAQRAHTSKDGETETTTTKISRNLASRIKYGNYVKWDPGGDTEGETTLKGKTQAILLAYSEPPQNFSFSPRSDESQRFFYGTHFMEGDVISCAAHFGGLRIWLPGFISEVRLRQVSSTGQTKAEVDAIPVGTVNETDLS